MLGINGEEGDGEDGGMSELPGDQLEACFSLNPQYPTQNEAKEMLR